MAMLLGAAAIQLTANLKPLNAALKTAKGKVTSSMTAAGKAARKALTIKMAVVAGTIATGLLGMAKAAAEFDANMSKVATLQVQNLDKLRAGIEDLAIEFGVNAPAQIQNLYDTLSAGIPEGSAIMVMREAAIGAKAGVGELSDALDLGTSLMNAYGLEASDMRDIMGQAVVAIKFGKTNMADLGGSVGKAAALMAAAKVPTTEFLSAIAALTTTGAPATEQVSALKAAISNIIQPSASAAAAAKVMELEFNASALASKGLVGFLEEVSVATGNNVAKMGQLFGSTEALNAVLALTGEQKDTFVAAMDGMKTAGDNLKESFDKATKADPTLKFNSMKERAAELGRGIGRTLIPVLDDLVDAITPILENMTEWIEKNPELTGKIAKWAGALSVLFLALSAVKIVLKPVLALVLALATPIGGITLAFLAAAAAGTSLGIAFNWITDKFDFLRKAIDSAFDSLFLFGDLLHKVGLLKSLEGTRTEQAIREGLVDPPDLLGRQSSAASFGIPGVGGVRPGGQNGGIAAGKTTVSIGSVTVMVNGIPGESPEDTGGRVAQGMIEALRFGLAEPGALLALPT